MTSFYNNNSGERTAEEGACYYFIENVLLLLFLTMAACRPSQYAKLRCFAEHPYVVRCTVLQSPLTLRDATA